MMRDELVELYGIDEAKVRILRPPVDAARFTSVDAAARASLRKRLGFRDNETVLLFPSSSHARKGLPLIEAAVRDMEATVVVAVAGRPVGHTSPHVRDIGFQREIEDCYRAADFTILASAYEPFGLVGIESVMCGTPVIMPSTMGCGDVIAAHAKYVFEHDEVRSLRETIRTAIAGGRTATHRHRLGTPSELMEREEAILYDTSVAYHVDSLLSLVNLVHAGRGSRTPAVARNMRSSMSTS
jgi:glycosyltransferase involved in cell wall biosynthesis